MDCSQEREARGPTSQEATAPVLVSCYEGYDRLRRVMTGSERRSYLREILREEWPGSGTEEMWVEGK